MLNLIFIWSCIPKCCLTIYLAYPKHRHLQAGSAHLVSARHCWVWFTSDRYLTQHITARGWNHSSNRITVVPTPATCLFIPASDFQMHLFLSLCFFSSLSSKSLQPDFQTGMLTEQHSMYQGASGNIRKLLFIWNVFPLLFFSSTLYIQWHGKDHFLWITSTFSAVWMIMC